MIEMCVLREVPVEVLEDSEQLAAWAKRSTIP